jgi:Uma2 family endonuclease
MTASAWTTDDVPELRAGDRLDRDEFERRYRAMPHVKKAELVEGVVYMPSPVSYDRHGRPTATVVWWLTHYAMHTPGVECATDATVRLDLDNEPQPDALLRVVAACGGASHTADDFVNGAPELACEVTASRAAYDLHDKKNSYRRNGVREYLAWRVEDRAVDWFVARGGRYELLPSGPDGVVRSEAMPGLWLDVEAMLRGDQHAVLAALERGLASAEHAAFVAHLGATRTGG